VKGARRRKFQKTGVKESERGKEQHLAKRMRGKDSTFRDSANTGPIIAVGGAGVYGERGNPGAGGRSGVSPPALGESATLPRSGPTVRAKRIYADRGEIGERRDKVHMVKKSLADK